MPPEEPLANDANARTETGEIKDQALIAPTEPKVEPKVEAKVEPKVEPKDGTTLLTKKDDGAKKDEPTGAPEKYEAFKVPDGFTLDEKVSSEASELFKKHNLPQAAAQELVDFYTAKTQEAFQQPYKAYKDMREGWVKEVKADPEIGGKLDQVKTTIGKALDGLGDPKLVDDFKAAMDLTGSGDSLPFVKVFYKMALALTEGGSVAGRGPSAGGQSAPGTGRVSAAQALYPNLK